MTDRLSEASDTTNAQVKLNKKREAVIIGLQKKQQDSTAEMGEQIEQLQKMKSKIDKDRALIINETFEVRAAADRVARSKNSAEKKLRELGNILADIRKKVVGGKKAIATMESRIRELESEDDERMQGMIDKLQTKIKSYKKQIEEAETIAALNQSKFKQMQTSLSVRNEEAEG